MNSSLSSRAMTMVEALAVVVILGIVLFITLPKLSQGRFAGELSAMQSKAVQLNIAKENYIAVKGTDLAQTDWNNNASGQGKYTLLLNAGVGKVSYISPAPASSNLNWTGAVGQADAFCVKGYTISIPPTVTLPVLIFDSNDLTHPIAY